MSYHENSCFLAMHNVERPYVTAIKSTLSQKVIEAFLWKTWTAKNHATEILRLAQYPSYVKTVCW